MSSFLSSVFFIVLLIGILVFVHELGHFIAARLFKVKVLNFSIGFGPKMFGFHRAGTDWTVRWLPLGGYVYMLGADPGEQVPDEEKDVAFNHKPLWKRSLIILAGPLFNLLLPIPILFFVLMANYDQDMPPVVGQVMDNSAAVGALERGDRVVAINGEDVHYFRDLQKIVSEAPGEPLTLLVERDGERLEVELTPEPTVLRNDYGFLQETVGRIGITPSQYEPVVGITDASGAAARAGLQTFDEIVAVDGEPVRTWIELKQRIARSPGQPLELVVLREQPVDIGQLGQLAVQTPRTLTLTPDAVDGRGVAGLDAASMFIAQVEPDSPAAAAGLRRGDLIVALDGKTFNFFPTLLDELAKAWEEPHTLEFMRDGQRHSATIQLEKVTVIGEYKEERPVIRLGFYNLERRTNPESVDVDFGSRLSWAGSRSIDMTIDASGALVMFIYKMAEGEVSTKAIGGPIMIGALASKAGEEGIESFLLMMAMISINLGIVNLLPIPVLDGGHLLLFAIEGIKRRPLSARTRQIASFVGLTIIVFLMIFAFKNDLERYWDSIFS